MCATTPKIDSISDTGFCPNILAYITYLWNDKVPLDKIIPFVKDMFDAQCSEDMIYNRLFSTSESLTGMMPQIKQDIASSDVISYHETCNNASGKNGRM